MCVCSNEEEERESAWKDGRDEMWEREREREKGQD